MVKNYIKRKTMGFMNKEEFSECVERLTKSVRRKLSLRDNVDDAMALDVIVNEVFSIQEESQFKLFDAEIIIEKIFLKIRSKFGILTPLLEDREVSEIMVNAQDKIFYEKNGQISKSPLCFDSERELEEIMQKIASQVHREINELNPIVDARLPDGSRVNGVYKNVAVSGPTLTIRKFSETAMTMEDLVQNGTVSDIAGRLLKVLVSCGYNIFVSGGTSTGKTTLLSALSNFIAKSERVIVIEDSTELRLGHIENLVQLECRNANALGKGNVTMAHLIKSSLRMRPDRIIVGEVRGEEVVDMLQAMNTGHDGSMSTGHGNSVKGMIKRLESMYLMAVPLNIDAIRSQIAEGIDIMVHIEKFGAGRKIVEISELVAYENGDFVINKLMSIDKEGNLKLVGNKLKNDYKANSKGGGTLDELRYMGLIS
jgi:pilus assembly protein CpaF